MADYHVLNDEDVEAHLTMSRAIAAMRRALSEQAGGTLVAPPRFSVEAGAGSLVFTAGAATQEDRAVGFRVYDTYPASATSTDQTQLVAAFDSETGTFRGVVIGSLIGAMRTAALDGVAIETLSPAKASTLTVVGAGFQARWHLRAALAAGSFERVLITNRTHERAVEWVEDLSDEDSILEFEAIETTRDAVEAADVLVCATSSRNPVIEADWLRPPVHITSIGPKTVEGHELPVEVAQEAELVVTDSLDQAESYEPSFFFDTSKVGRLCDVSTGELSRPPGGTSVFLSVGLAGTEVVLANELFSALPLDGTS